MPRDGDKKNIFPVRRKRLCKLVDMHVHAGVLLGTSNFLVCCWILFGFESMD